MRPRRVGLAVVLGLGLALAACSGSDPSFKADQMPNIVLQKEDAPRGTDLDEGSSGERPIDRFTSDKIYQNRLKEIGFDSSYFVVFHTPERISVLATSFVVLFKDGDAATTGIAAIEEHIRSDGIGIKDVPAEGLGSESFGLGGTIQPGFPPGFAYIWRRGNGVFGLIAVGDPGTIDEDAARVLAERMEARAG